MPVVRYRSPNPQRVRLGVGLLLCLALAVTWLAPSTALAWTRAQIRGAQAHVELRGSDAAQVALSLRIHVGGGWLSELELPGLAQAIVPNADKPPTLVNVETGDKYAAEMELRRGAWLVNFGPKRSAPWRGDYTLLLFYEEPLATEPLNDDARRAHWTMPPWRLGIEGTHVWISAPARSHLAQNVESSPFGTRKSVDFAGRTLLALHRAQLPRDTDWPIAFDVPRSALTGTAPTASAAKVKPTTPKPTAGDPPMAPAWTDASLWLPVTLLLLAWMKHRFIRRFGRHRRFRVRPLVEAKPAVRAVVAGGLAVAAWSLWQAHSLPGAVCLFAMVLMFVDRGADHATDSPLHWALAHQPRLRMLQRVRVALSPHRWFDVTTAVGALAFGLLLSSCAWAAKMFPEQQQSLLVMVLFALPLWTTVTRLHMPWDGQRVALRLQRWVAKRSSTLGNNSDIETSAPRLGFDDHDLARDARIALRCVKAIPGLVALDLTLVTDGRSLRRRVALLVQALENSAADLALSGPVSTRQATNGRAVHVVPEERILDSVAALCALYEGDPASDTFARDTSAQDASAADASGSASERGRAAA